VPSEDDTFRLKLANDIGYIKGTVEGLDGKVDALGHKVEGLEGAVNSKISSVHQSIAGLVRREDCAAHMGKVQQEIGGAFAAAGKAAEAAAEAARKAAAVEAAGAQAVEGGTGRLITPKAGNLKPSFWERAVDHSRGLTSILVFLGMLGAGIVALTHFVGKVEHSLAQADELQKQTQAAVAKKLAQTQVVYVKAPGGADGGAARVVGPGRPAPKRLPGKKR